MSAPDIVSAAQAISVPVERRSLNPQNASSSPANFPLASRPGFWDKLGSAETILARTLFFQKSNLLRFTQSSFLSKTANFLSWNEMCGDAPNPGRGSLSRVP